MPLDRRGPESPYNQPRLNEVRVMPGRGKSSSTATSPTGSPRAIPRRLLEPYAADYHVEAAMMYDARRLYLAAHVADPAPMCNVVDPSSDLQFVWAGGSVVVRLCADRRRQWPLMPRRRRPLPRRMRQGGADPNPLSIARSGSAPTNRFRAMKSCRPTSFDSPCPTRLNAAGACRDRQDRRASRKQRQSCRRAT